MEKLMYSALFLSIILYPFKLTLTQEINISQSHTESDQSLNSTIEYKNFKNIIECNFDTLYGFRKVCYGLGQFTENRLFSIYGKSYPIEDVIYVYDISDPSSPKELCNVTIPVRTKKVLAYERNRRLLYVIYGFRIRIFQETINSLIDVGWIELENVVDYYHIIPDNNILYIVARKDENPYDGRYSIYIAKMDVSNTKNPRIIDEWKIPYYSSSYGIESLLFSKNCLFTITKISEIINGQTKNYISFGQLRIKNDEFRNIFNPIYSLEPNEYGMPQLSSLTFSPGKAPSKTICLVGNTLYLYEYAKYKLNDGYYGTYGTKANVIAFDISNLNNVQKIGSVPIEMMWEFIPLTFPISYDMVLAHNPKNNIYYFIGRSNNGIKIYKEFNLEKKILLRDIKVHQNNVYLYVIARNNILNVASVKKTLVSKTMDVQASADPTVISTSTSQSQHTTLEVIVTSDNIPVEGAHVDLSADFSGEFNTVSPGTFITNANGSITATWTPSRIPGESKNVTITAKVSKEGYTTSNAETLVKVNSYKYEIINLKLTDEKGDAINKSEIKIREPNDTYNRLAPSLHTIGETYRYRNYESDMAGVKLVVYYYGEYGKDEPVETFDSYYETNQELRDLKSGVQIQVPNVGLYKICARTTIQIDEYEENDTDFWIVDPKTTVPSISPDPDYGCKDDKGKYEIVEATYIKNDKSRHYAFRYLKRYTYISYAITSSYVSSNEGQEQAYLVLPTDPINLARLSNNYSENDNAEILNINKTHSNEKVGQMVSEAFVTNLIDEGLQNFYNKPLDIYGSIAISAVANLSYLALLSPDELFIEDILTDLLIDACVTTLTYSCVYFSGLPEGPAFLLAFSLDLFFNIIKRYGDYLYMKDGLINASLDDLFYSKQDHDKGNFFENTYDITITNRGDTKQDIILKALFSIPPSDRKPTNDKEIIPNMFTTRFSNWKWNDCEEDLKLEYTIFDEFRCEIFLKDIPKIPYKHPANLNRDEEIDDFELLNYIKWWKKGFVDDFDLLDAIDIYSKK